MKGQTTEAQWMLNDCPRTGKNRAFQADGTSPPNPRRVIFAHIAFFGFIRFIRRAAQSEFW
jgi:hypothetical protein